MVTAVLTQEAVVEQTEKRARHPADFGWFYSVPSAGVKYYSYRQEPAAPDRAAGRRSDLPSDLFASVHVEDWDALLLA